ncbi:chemotaxis-specific protein-glutamate methyltransferase CheB [Roseofilum casamattae]|uniref:Protein-glutamate methylesterase/protein-glutamine glutaminase n=1 Tax=Roseofilum casamattae BLCC-M143 TaxID=3022442 RepID=A0ABT7BS72_9CYAN|nr:chemotaxis-specific protein-glutamate methyltransferase CheB [Roseofilum casamattae]MDJ1182020.1 chemotaxis-specific protein-glutamate methyltransferase CheB [Roseofilum casamattae BLCC-M143]
MGYLTRSQNPIRVIIVEDSPIALLILRRMLDASDAIQVVGTARNGKEAIALIPQVNPHVVCTDLHMPEMDGLTLTQEIMAAYPRPILAISSSVRERDTQQVFQLLEAGAVDVFPKPEGGLGVDRDRIQRTLIQKIKVLSGVSVFAHQRHKSDRLSLQPSVPTPRMFSSSRLPSSLGAIALGASTGGPQALQQILSQFPASLPVPIICVQHISQGFLQGFIDWLSSDCQLPISIARSGDRPQPGTIYFPPERSHLLLDRSGRFIYSQEPGVGGHCPSITPTFKAIARYYQRHSIAVLLTGMGRDGADGMLAISNVGGITLAQNEATCTVFGMPKEAIALGAVRQVLPVEAIAPTILHYVPQLSL